MSSGKLFLAGLAGALGLWAGFPNNFIQIPPAVFLWPLSLVFLGLYADAPMKAFRMGWLCSFCGIALALYWLYLPIYTVGRLPLPAAAGCALFICAGLALQGGAYTLGVFYLKPAGIFSFAVLASLLWYLLEYLSALVIGVPWLPLCGALPALPILLQGASLIGGYALGALWLLCALFILIGICGKFQGAIIMNFKALGCGLVIAASLLAYGAWRLEIGQQAPEPSGPDSMTALFIEANVDQNQKWVPVFQASTLDLYMRLSQEGLRALPKKDWENLLLLWPETALPFFLETSPALAGRLVQYVEEIKAPLLFGAPGMESGKRPQDSAVYNRAYLFNPDGRIEGFYDKERLVPFGEYTPAWLKLEFLEPLLQGVGVYEKGRDAAPLRYASLALGMLICYEGIFPWLAQERVAMGANILVDISNDGWFGASPAAEQHLHLTIARCVEQNRWLLRSTNTGISAIADNLGRIRLKGESFKTGYLYGRAGLLTEKSVYHKLADYIPWLALLAFIGLLFRDARKYRFLWRSEGRGLSLRNKSWLRKKYFI